MAMDKVTLPDETERMHEIPLGLMRRAIEIADKLGVKTGDITVESPTTPQSESWAIHISGRRIAMTADGKLLTSRY